MILGGSVYFFRDAGFLAFLLADGFLATFAAGFFAGFFAAGFAAAGSGDDLAVDRRSLDLAIACSMIGSNLRPTNRFAAAAKVVHAIYSPLVGASENGGMLSAPAMT
mmetsp:Transcript_21487/g.66020  ORF Transcript_21487/g.66020 Transcript_21487/m.66020 type:complete len:107 (+) Transcript_21487:62-382(+)